MLAAAAANAEGNTTGSAVSIYYKDGLFIESADGNWSAHPELRAQLRYSNVDGEVDSAGPEDLLRDESSFSINRARFKLGGVAYRPWLAY